MEVQSVAITLRQFYLHDSFVFPVSKDTWMILIIESSKMRPLIFTKCNDIC
jgi:hypothetical protein